MISFLENRKRKNVKSSISSLVAIARPQSEGALSSKGIKSGKQPLEVAPFQTVLAPTPPPKKKESPAVARAEGEQPMGDLSEGSDRSRIGATDDFNFAFQIRPGKGKVRRDALKAVEVSSNKLLERTERVFLSGGGYLQHAIDHVAEVIFFLLLKYLVFHSL